MSRQKQLAEGAVWGEPVTAERLSLVTGKNTAKSKESSERSSIGASVKAVVALPEHGEAAGGDAAAA